ncbi:hypothetical protein D8B26_008141 [Coccidioides posadasii str. Silveira]|uniref:Uncharacterized protein n=1 Tax=Coccidioides posadasii (strain RMSCC 757 / Silveira) TaxID=443226 RepID=E9DDT9_COCPS|nr:conserved hypothetical protein [Coccidioides posadasii str. Silveira]QVM13533.1 hypothetical protein D8B26_008141 [Coccidioides posadasii str. Silveira]
MPPASSPCHQYRPTSTPTAPSNPRSSITDEVAQGKKKKNAARKDNKTAKAETKTLLDDLEVSQPEQQLLEPIPTQFNPRPMANDGEPPVLDALSTLPLPEEVDITRRTDTWARSIPFGKSPPQNIMNDAHTEASPPDFSLPVDRGGFQQPSMSPSPIGKPRPISLGTEYSSPTRHQSRDRQKRNSMNTQYHHQPPLPHLPQAHFYSAPDIEIPGVPSPAIRRAQESGCSFCAIDMLPSHKSRSGKKVLVVGQDGMLEVIALDNEQSRSLGAIKGLNGRVLDAKILTWASGNDPFSSSRPLIGVTIFGPIPQEDTAYCSSAASENADLAVPGVPNRPDTLPSRADLPRMQTRVQIYSLRTQSLVATLFATKPEPCYPTFPGTSPTVPPPAGELKLYSSGNYVVLASGTSGEVFIFGAGASQSPGSYCCLGKTWTSVRMRDTRRHSNSSNSTNTDEIQSDPGRELGPADTPILSLSGRWLAVVPPPPYRTSLRGTIHCPRSEERTYGIDAHNPPSRPSITCGVDCNQDGLLNKIAKGVTQELVRGAAWTGGQVAQTWHNYFNKDTQPSQPTATRRAHPFEPSSVNYLPPTHAQEPQHPSTGEPDLVSLIDLKLLEEDEGAKAASTITPVATFQPPSGCSFASLSPSGLMLLTASKNGDVQHVWDLMQMRHCRARILMLEDTSSTAASHGSSAQVREIAKFDRMTTTSILDVKWTGPIGERLAIVTKNGTIHLYDIPRGAFQWPPLRRVQGKSSSRQRHSESPPGADLSEANSSNLNRLSTAVKAIGGTTQPFMAALRGRAPSMGAAFGTGAGFALSSRGSKVLASGLSKSVGAATETMNALRHFGENRLHLSNFARDCGVSRITWSGDEKDPLLGVVDGEYFKIYQIRRGSTGKKKRDQSVFGAKIREIRVPSSLRNPVGPSQALLTMATADINGFWSLPSPTRPVSPRSLKFPPLSQAEIETNAPYQPFHTDRRVNLMVFSGSYEEENINGDPWVFGNAIPSVQLQVHGHAYSEDCISDTQNPGDAKMENLVSLGSSGEKVEYAVITTRRKKTTSSAAGTAGVDDDEFFENDCDILDFASDRV